MRRSKSALFLMELIIVIFFFSLTSAVCLQIFVKAHSVRIATEGLNYAVLWADNASELFYAYEDNISIEETVMNDYKACSPYSDQYTINLNFSADDDLSYMEYSFIRNNDNTCLYSFTFQKHIKEVSD